jgi:putative hydrolase of the HAD superfamily
MSAGGDERRKAGALLVDFGGVLTTSVFASFRAWAGMIGPDPYLIERLFRQDEHSARLLVECEAGRMSLEEFERAFALRLSDHGIHVPPEGIVAGLTETLQPDRPMLAAVGRLHACGIPTVIVSNSLGPAAYDGYELEAIADQVVLSSEVGARKPSRKIYEAARRVVDRPASECLMVDDLRHNLVGAERLGMRGVLHIGAETTLPELECAFGLELGDLGISGGPR